VVAGSLKKNKSATDDHTASCRETENLATDPTWTLRTPPKAMRHMVNRHPDWLMRHISGRPIRIGDREGIYADPGNPKVREYLAAVYVEVARKYDVDGIHFDYIRYPSRDFCYCDGCVTRFAAMAATKLPPEEARLLSAMPDRLIYQAYFPSQWDQWRRDQVTALVRRVHHEVKAIKPKVVVSASTITWGPWTPFEQSEAYREVLQDWHAWMREGIIDVACPMTYFRETKTVLDHATDALRYGPVWPGLGCYLNPPEKTVEMVKAVLEAGAQGVCLFAYQQLSPGPGASDERTYELLRTGPFAEPAEPDHPE